jgi:hypothetical protein
MVKKPRNKKTKPKNGSSLGNVIDTAVDGFFRFLISMVNNVGFPGAVLFFIMYLMVTFSNDQQKEEFFNMWILFKGSDTNCAKIITYILIFAILTFIAQWVYYKRRTGLDRKEIERLSQIKTSQQGGALGALHHSN